MTTNHYTLLGLVNMTMTGAVGTAVAFIPDRPTSISLYTTAIQKSAISATGELNIVYTDKNAVETIIGTANLAGTTTVVRFTLIDAYKNRPFLTMETGEKLEVKIKTQGTLNAQTHLAITQS